jgi:PPE-repeat protein
MTAPIWMAFPPEVHSALLSSGPGAGALLSAAGAWSSLSEEYASAATELTTVLGTVQAGTWQGPSADSYLAANVPYLAWLLQAAVNSTAMAAQHETAAVAYTTALAAMPTLVELGANHAIHAVLLATNFFGINTIPIAVNEADYARMWIQAASTMTAYQAVSSAAVASAPQTTPAPQIVKSQAPTTQTVGYSGEPYPNPTSLSQTIADLDYNITAAIADFNGPTNPTTWVQFGQFWSTTITNVSNGLAKELASIAANPTTAFSYPTLLWLLDFTAGRIFDVIVSIKFVLEQPGLYVAVGLGVVITNIGAVVSAASGLAGFAGLAGLAGLAALPAGAETMPVAAQPPAGAPPPVAPISASPVSVPTTAPSTAPATVAAPAPTTAGATGGPPPPPSADPGGFPYLVGGISMTSAASDRNKTRRSKSDTAAAPSSAAAAALTWEKVQARRWWRAKQRGYGDEFMDLNIEVDPDWGELPAPMAASDRGAGTLGFAGTVSTGDGRAAGLTTLSRNGFDEGPRMPMVPGTWDAGASEGEGAG